MKKEDLAIYADYPAVPVTMQFKVLQFNPLNLVSHLRQQGHTSYLLTGAPKPKLDGYTFIGYQPKMKIHYRNGQLTVIKNGKTTTKKTAIKPYLEELLNRFRTPKLPDSPPFQGGLVGYFAYDYGQYANPTLSSSVSDPYQLDDVDLLLADQVIAYNQRTKIVTLSQIVPTNELNNRFEQVQVQLGKLKRTILQLQQSFVPVTLQLKSALQLQFNLPTFTNLVEQTKQHIVAGDIFQLILSNPQHADMAGSLFAAAPTLFHQSPSPYQFYFQDGDFEALGASPETLISRQGTQLVTYPLAGTRRRGKTEAEDRRLAAELQHSEKELSEHNMLIDLGRNDLGRVSRFGSVKVTSCRQLLRFSQVMHLGSTIESEVRSDQSSIDILDALMPAGTLSGAPKVRAMQLINELEQNKRGLYGGCLGYLDFDGDLDLCIGIRLAYRKGTNLVVHSGAGIVADSIAKYEYQEFNNKARSVVTALQQVAKQEVHYAVNN
ncbi:anthranilate synthase component I family protein [Loigolactobacillus backii]|uniref:anthranilate synthase component I family protein n=1 Tax=Loigolactobacillus backii TaxID=375175 RepID=UPI0007F0D938|nr:anthranilate synthase component I family protein [Loigolactobacillus backii]ANK60871.1 anthranilate synthase [Loigolactobacillus backii]ANK65824.1 anthranilate synthase [Loigolactobacillus backii]ANK68300.1 anthranilate synthase [Loigolactobacillus backii]MDA5388749.1 anthranilate synthase component I family protein [Loigolactobacillus backii]MDA5391241.1 anthranilate synthase component I family protein [Loigolactobacillus backii]